MEIIDRGEYISWKLPANCTVVLTSNPDDGNYQVSSMDIAQKSRYISINLGFAADVWADWAEENNLDSRGINFLLLHKELMDKKNNVQIVNPRSYVTFLNTISGIQNWNSPESLGLILNIAYGCFSADTSGTVAMLFTTFINNQLDRLMEPARMLEAPWETVKRELHAQLHPEGVFRADIAAVLSLRFKNYISYCFNDLTCRTDDVMDRVIKFIEASSELLTQDLLFDLVKHLVTNHGSRCGRFLLHPALKSVIV